MNQAATRLMGLLVVFAVAQTAYAADLSRKYLEGVWSLDGKEACGTDDLEYVKFRSDGVLETGENGRVSGAGFWELKTEGQEVVFHVATSPAFHVDDLKDLGGVYDSFDIRVLTYNVEADQFGAIGLLEDQVARATFDRCP